MTLEILFTYFLLVKVFTDDNKKENIVTTQELYHSSIKPIKESTQRFNFHMMIFFIQKYV